MKKEQYIYKAVVVKVYDGDTITVDIDLGMYVWLKNQTIRFARINAAELKGTNKLKGQAARDWLRRRILEKEVVIETIKDTKETYGRWLANVWLEDVCINDEMLTKGIAPPYKG